MDIQRQCVWCGKTYLTHGFDSRYCNNKAKTAKKKEEKSRFEAVAPNTLARTVLAVIHHANSIAREY